ncbi:MAG: hypothetical protein IBX68_07955 [Dehalococcoidia bacterium]|nr:hypothetical protein [Dehalococcoidia bacterium]
MGSEFGVAYFFAQILALVKAAFGFLFQTDGYIYWTQSLDGQWVLSGNLPSLTPKADDILAAVMTIIHNGAVFAAQLSTLLPANVVVVP